MELEIRNENGGHVLTFYNEMAERALKQFQFVPELTLTTKTLIKGGEKKTYKVFLCTSFMAYKLFNGIGIVLNKDAYIKIIL